MNTKMNRRDFLFLAKERETAAELSCEQLFMRCVDSALDGYDGRVVQQPGAASRFRDVIEPGQSGVAELRRTQTARNHSGKVPATRRLCEVLIRTVAFDKSSPRSGCQLPTVDSIVASMWFWRRSCVMAICSPGCSQ